MIRGKCIIVVVSIIRVVVVFRIRSDILRRRLEPINVAGYSHAGPISDGVLDTAEPSSRVG